MKVRGSFLGMAAALAFALFTVGGALAQDATPEALEPVASPAAVTDCATLMGIGTPDDGCMILINGVADSGPLDLYLNGFKAVDGLSFADVSGYFALPAGAYTIELVPAGQPIEATLVSLADYAITAGEATEVAAVGTADAPRFVLSTANLSPLPPADEGFPVGNTRIRAINGVADAPAVNVTMIGGDIADRLATKLEFQDTSAYLEKIAGSYRVQVAASDGEFVTLLMDERTFDEDTVYSAYAIGTVANDDLRILDVAVDLSDGSSTLRAVPPALASEIVEVSSFSIYEGDCAQLSGLKAFELTGSGYQGAGPGTLAPWGGGDDPSGALGAVPVQYGEGELDDMNFGDLLGGRTVSVVVHDAATGGVVACGEVGGVVEEADRFWQHDRLIVGLRPVGDTGISGTATFTEDTGILTDKINVAVSLVTDEA